MRLFSTTILAAGLTACGFLSSPISAQEQQAATKTQKPKQLYLQATNPEIDWAPGDPEKQVGSKAGTSHAAFTLDKNRVAGTEVGSVKIGLAYALGEIKPVKIIDSNTSHWFFPAAFVWTDFDGTFDAANGNKTKLRIGLQADWLRSGGIFDSQQVSVAPFYLTDMHFNAEGYGVDVIWQPVRAPRLMRSLRNGTIKFDGGISALRVDDGGETGLASGTDYLWVTGKIEGRYDLFADTLSTPLSITGEYVVAHDVVSGRTEELTTIGLEVPLVENDDVKLRLDHTFGREFTKLEDKHETAVKLLVRF